MEKAHVAEKAAPAADQESREIGAKLHEDSGWMDRMKHRVSNGVHRVGDGLHHAGEHAKDLIPVVRKKGEQIAHSETTQKVTREAKQIGKEVVQEQVGKAKETVEAGKRGDVLGVIKNGAPIAGALYFGPEQVAGKIIKEKAVEVAAEKLQQRNSDKQSAGHKTEETHKRTDVSKAVQELPDLVITGSEHHKAATSHSKH